MLGSGLEPQGLTDPLGRPAGMCHQLSVLCLCPASWLTEGPQETGPRSPFAESKSVRSQDAYGQVSLCWVCSPKQVEIPPQFYYSSSMSSSPRISLPTPLSKTMASVPTPWGIQTLNLASRSLVGRIGAWVQAAGGVALERLPHPFCLSFSTCKTKIINIL